MLRASRLLLKTDGSRKTEAPTPDSLSFEHGVKGDKEAALEITRIMRENTVVWRQADFDLPRTLLDRAIIALTHYTIAVSTNPRSSEAGQARDRLNQHLQETEQLR